MYNCCCYRPTESFKTTKSSASITIWKLWQIIHYSLFAMLQKLLICSYIKSTKIDNLIVYPCINYANKISKVIWQLLMCISLFNTVENVLNILLYKYSYNTRLAALSGSPIFMNIECTIIQKEIRNISV